MNGYRSMARDDGKRGFPEWVRDLRGKSGIYIVQTPGDPRPEYVGESHTDRLYDTLTRHFQAWHSKGENPYVTRGAKGIGPTWDRDAVRVRVIVMPARTDAERDAILDRQDKMIEEMRPEHNEAGKPQDDLWSPF